MLGGGGAQVVRRDVGREGEDLATGGPDVDGAGDGVHRDRRGARHREASEERAGPQVVDIEGVARRHVEALPAARHRARPGPGRDVPARLDRRVADRRPEVALRDDPVVPEQVDPLGDRVLREVRMGVLVDRVRLAVAPVLEELDRRPGVVDLVEVHPHRLAEAERAQDQHRDHEDQQEPEVQPVQASAPFASERGRAVEGGALVRPRRGGRGRRRGGRGRAADGRGAAARPRRPRRRPAPGRAGLASRGPALRRARRREGPPRAPGRSRRRPAEPGRRRPRPGRRRGRAPRPRRPPTNGSPPRAGCRGRRTRRASARGPGCRRRAGSGSRRGSPSWRPPGPRRRPPSGAAGPAGSPRARRTGRGSARGRGSGGRRRRPP